MITLDLKVDIKKATKYLTNVQRKQVPFALARALTWTAKDTQADLQDNIPKVFNVTRKWWLAKQPTGIKIKPATKAAPVALIFTDAYFANLQEDGGIKHPFKGAGLLVPSDKVPKYGRRSGGATRVLAQRKIVRKGGTAGGDPITTLKSGKRGVFRRRGKKRLPIDLMYSYVDSAKIKPRMNFKALAIKVVKRKFPEQFQKSLLMALKTAR